MIRAIKIRILLLVMARTCCSAERQQNQTLNVEYFVRYPTFIRDTKRVLVIPTLKSFCFCSNLKTMLETKPTAVTGSLTSRTVAIVPGVTVAMWSWRQAGQAGKYGMVSEHHLSCS